MAQSRGRSQVAPPEVRPLSHDPHSAGHEDHGPLRQISQILACFRVRIEARLRGPVPDDDVHAHRRCDSAAYEARIRFVDRDRVCAGDSGIQPHHASELRCRGSAHRHGGPRARTRHTGPCQRHACGFLRTPVRSGSPRSLRRAQRGGSGEGPPQGPDGCLRRRDHGQHDRRCPERLHHDRSLRMRLLRLRGQRRCILHRQRISCVRRGHPCFGIDNKDQHPRCE